MDAAKNVPNGGQPPQMVVQPQVPQMPQMPQVPQMAQMPQMPQMSQVPQMPQMAQMAQMPQVPQMAQMAQMAQFPANASVPMQQSQQFYMALLQQQHQQQQITARLHAYMSQKAPGEDFLLPNGQRLLKSYFAENPASWGRLKRAYGNPHFQNEIVAILVDQQKWERTVSMRRAAAPIVRPPATTAVQTIQPVRPTIITERPAMPNKVINAPPVVPPRPSLTEVSAKAEAELKAKFVSERAKVQAVTDARMRFISKPQNPEEKSHLPRSRLRKLVKNMCGPSVKLNQEAEVAMKMLAEDFVADAVAFGLSMARRRRSKHLEARDIALYMKLTWDIDIPDGKGEVVPYKRLKPSDLHKSRLAAVRRGNLTVKKHLTTDVGGGKDQIKAAIVEEVPQQETEGAQVQGGGRVGVQVDKDQETAAQAGRGDDHVMKEAGHLKVME